MSAPLIIDARGHRCPVPSLRLRRALERAAAGDEVRLLADDPLARIDVPHLLAALGHVLIEMRSEGDYWVFIARNHAPSPP